MAQLAAGDTSPGFELDDDGGKRVALDELRKQRLVLYFFPKADTSG